MKKILSVTLICMILFGCLSAFAMGDAPSVVIYGEYENGDCVIAGTSSLDIGRSVNIIVFDPDMNAVYHKRLLTEQGGAFSWSFPLGDNASEGLYTVKVSDVNGTSEETFSYPFASEENKIIIKQDNVRILMTDAYTLNEDYDSFCVYLENCDVRSGTLKDGSYTVSGLPDGMSCVASGDSQKGCIVFEITGTATAAVEDKIPLTVSLKLDAVSPKNGVNSPSDETTCAIIYDYVSSTTPVMSLSSDNSTISMRSSTQMKDATFEIESQFHNLREGEFTEDTDYSVSLPEGFEVSAVSNGKTVTFTVMYGGYGISDTKSISVTLKPAAFVNNVNFDSNELTVTCSPVLQPSSGGGGGFGGGGGGGFSAGKTETKDDAEKVELPVTPIEKPRKTFSDVSEHWAKDSVELLAGAGIVNGVSESQFNPDALVTRAEFAAMLIRAAGFDDSSAGSGFRDVNADDWFADAVYAGYNAGILKGSDGNFYPLNQITREEMTKMVVSAFLKITGPIDITPSYGTFFTDYKSISDWAREAVDTAAQLGLVNGVKADVFSPRANSTRAEAATVIYRMLQKSEQINSLVFPEASGNNQNN